MVHTPNRSLDGPCSSSSGYCYYATGVGGACAGMTACNYSYDSL
eukprot:COSAG01_NODE_28_length_36622_cov_14.695751_21_plen_44_part_00